MNRAERDTIDRAYHCLKKHPELGRVLKKDLIALENYCTNGLVRTAMVKDRYSRRVFQTGENNGSYYDAYVVEEGE